MAVCEKDTKERDSVAHNNGHQEPRGISESFGCEDAGIQPENRELAEDCAKEPQDAAS